MSAAAVDAAPAQSPSPSDVKPNAPSELVEFPHYKELQRNLRNNVKKLNATTKVDAVVANNPNKTLDQLVAEKVINEDQKAQALKKPVLQAAIVQLEAQIVHYKEFAAFFEGRLESQKAELEKAQQEVEALQEKTASATPTPVEPTPEVKKEDATQQLLCVSKFLSTAAIRRHRGEDETTPESRAFEGVLAQVYGGSLEAVASMNKLIEGTDEKVVSVDGEALEVTYARVKELSEEAATPQPAPQPAAESAPVTDPTTAHAASTELEDPTYVAEAATNDAAISANEAENVAPPPQTLVGDGANAVAESAWEPHSDPLASSTNTEGFVEIPRDPAETETGLQATPANITADVAPQGSTEPAKTENGFESVGKHQRQSSFRGRGRGRGRGGDGFRGRGRGDFRGRGRGRGSGGRGRGGANGAPAATPAAQ
ncbi:hypothetical protein BDW74DRAFT_104957 [Aspergillus multicolor]|uniref:uncharacterized protein n=1 Tax=Aspergillus multicolor TaxID=41759 RepID=UPI003CCCF7F2